MTLEGDWIFLRTAVPELQEYVLSKDVYRILRPPERSPGGVQLPQMTIGNLLLSLARLRALPLTVEQQAELAELNHQIEKVRSEWLANWGVKLEKEFSSRLNLWQQFMRELRGDARQQKATYATEVRHRVILQLLRAEFPNGLPSQYEEQLTMLDQILRGHTNPGEFVWEPVLEKSFRATHSGFFTCL